MVSQVGKATKVVKVVAVSNSSSKVEEEARAGARATRRIWRLPKEKAAKAINSLQEDRHCRVN